MQPLEIAVCSWSLKIPDLSETLSTIKNTLGLNTIHLGFWDDSYKDTDRIIELIKANGLEVSAVCVGFAGEDYSTMQTITATGGYKPDDVWEERFKKTVEVAELTAQLGTKLLSTHIGFVPHDTSDPQYAVMVDRLKQVTDALGEGGVTLVMETGQEKAEALLGFIGDVGRENIGANFDPANMILYGCGEPLEAVQVLKDKVIHVHAKDANWSDKPGETWGEEVVLGTGQANIPKLVETLKAQGYTGPLAIEREVGETPDRIADIQEGIKLLKSLV